MVAQLFPCLTAAPLRRGRANRSLGYKFALRYPCTANALTVAGLPENSGSRGQPLVGESVTIVIDPIAQRLHNLIPHHLQGRTHRDPLDARNGHLVQAAGTNSQAGAQLPLQALQRGELDRIIRVPLVGDTILVHVFQSVFQGIYLAIPITVRWCFRGVSVSGESPLNAVGQTVTVGIERLRVQAPGGFQGGTHQVPIGVRIGSQAIVLNADIVPGTFPFLVTLLGLSGPARSAQAHGQH